MIRIVILLAPFIISIGTAGLFCAGCNPAQDNIKSDIIIVLPNVPCRGCEGLVPEEGEGDVQSEGELRKEGEDAGPEGETEGEPVEAEGETGEGEIEGESAQYVTGVWACGEDTEFVYSFCENGTFTLYTVYYWGKCHPPDICREMEGCGTYVTDEDSYSPTIDLHFSSGDDCTALGRYIRVSEGQVQMYLNISACGELRPESPYYYPMRSSTLINCICEEDVAGELLIEDKVSLPD